MDAFNRLITCCPQLILWLCDDTLQGNMLEVYSSSANDQLRLELLRARARIQINVNSLHLTRGQNEAVVGKGHR